MRKFLILTLLSLTLLTTGCMTQSKLTYTTPERFELTTESQDAVFYVAFGWTGGPAGSPVINLKTGRPRELNGQDIYIDSDGAENIKVMAKEKGVYSNIVKVSAKIQLSEGASGSVAIPPGPDGELPKRSYVEAEIIELYGTLPSDRFGNELKK